MKFDIFTRMNVPTYVNETTIARNVWGIEWSTEATDANDAVRKFLHSSSTSSKRFSELDKIVAVRVDEKDSFQADKIIIDDTYDEIISKGLGHDILSNTVKEIAGVRSRCRPQ